MRAVVVSPLGRHRIAVTLREGAIPLFGVRTTLTPTEPLLTSFTPRDLYPLDENGDPTKAVGQVEAAQRGLNTAAIYFRLTEPDFGSVLYLQDLTALNRFFELTGTKPDGAMGGIWPEIGRLSWALLLSIHCRQGRKSPFRMAGLLCTGTAMATNRIWPGGISCCWEKCLKQSKGREPNTMTG